MILDLQGTLGGDGLGNFREFTFYPCTVPALSLPNRIGMLNIVLANQSHIAKGLFTYQQYEVRVKQFQEELSQAGVRIDAIYFCPHRGSDACARRKPKREMLHEAQQEFSINLSESFSIGDMGLAHMLLAHNAGCKGILVCIGLGERALDEFRQTWADVEPDFIAADVLQAAEWIVWQIGKEARD